MRQAKARKAAHRMNGTEAEFARLFLGRQPWGYEEITLRLGDDCRYTPDFWTLDPDDVLVLIEVKGHWRDDAKVKIRAAAEKYPQFRFRAFSKLPRGGGWQQVNFGPAEAA